MEKKDLIAHSPVRFFDNATSAALKDGEMGLVTAKKGLGKTSILVQFGIDSLLNDKALVHVSFDQQSSNVIAWYSSVMAEIAKKKNFNLDDVNEEIVRNRTILNFNQETFTLPKVVNTLKALKEGGIAIASVVVDGLDGFRECHSVPRQRLAAVESITANYSGLALAVVHHRRQRRAAVEQVVIDSG